MSVSIKPDLPPVPHKSNGKNGIHPATTPVAIEPLRDEDFSFGDVLDIFRRGKWIILSAFLLVLGLVALYTFSIEPEYEATSVLYVNNQQTTPQLGELLGLESNSRNISNEIEILKSRTMALRVAEQLVRTGGARLSVLEPEDETPLTPLDIAERLRDDFVSVKPVGRDVDLIDITVSSTSPEEGRLIANTYAEQYVLMNQSSSRSRMTASREFLTDVTGRFSEQLAQSENDLTAFLNETGVVAPDEEAKALLDQISGLQEIRYQTQLELGMAQAELRGVEAEIERVTPGLARQISSGDDVMIDRLKEQVARLQLEQEQTYALNPELRAQTPATGRLADINRQIEALSRQIESRVARLVADARSTGGVDLSGASAIPVPSGNGEAASGAETGRGTDGGSTSGGSLAGGTSSAERLQGLSQLQRQLTTATIRISGLQARLGIADQELNRFTTQFHDIPNKAMVLKRLERTQATQEQLYLTFIEKLQEASIAERSELGYIEIVDRAVAPKDPVRPRVPLNLLLGAMLGAILGVGLAFVRYTMDTKLRTPDDLKKLGFTVLGTVPNIGPAIRQEFDGKEVTVVDGHRYSTVLFSWLSPVSSVAEAYRRLRTNIQFSRPDATVQTILVTSSEPGEGKSSTSMNLAITMAIAGRRTVYIDTDLHRPVGHKMLGLPRTPGLVELLFEPGPLQMDRFATGVEHLYVVPAGREVPYPSEVLGSKKMRTLVEQLRQEFDVIIIDTPPVLVFADALVLAPHCDATLLVASSNKTERHDLERASESLRTVGAKVIGLLLNRFDSKAAGYKYKYSSDYKYRDYHTQPGKKKSKKAKVF